MINYAERYFYLAAAENGETRHAVLLRKLDRAERRDREDRVAELQAELTMPPFPRALNYLWTAYLRLRRRKGSTDMGSPQPIEWPDIKAFVQITGMRLIPWECQLIEALDDVYMQPAPKPVLPEGQKVVTAASANDAVGVRSILGGIAHRRVVKRKKGG